jgi:hypothetical protein
VNKDGQRPHNRLGAARTWRDRVGQSRQPLLGDLTDLEHVGGTRRALEEARRDDHVVTCGDSDEEGEGERS